MYVDMNTSATFRSFEVGGNHGETMASHPSMSWQERNLTAGVRFAEAPGHQPLVHAPNGSDDTNCGKPNDKPSIFLKKKPPTYPIYESFMPLLRMVYWSYLSMYQPSPGPTDSLGDVPIPKLDVRDQDPNHLSKISAS